MRFFDLSPAALLFILGRQFADRMTLTRAAEDHQSGPQCETGFAKKKSHNAPAQ